MSVALSVRASFLLSPAALAQVRALASRTDQELDPLSELRDRALLAYLLQKSETIKLCIDDPEKLPPQQPSDASSARHAPRGTIDLSRPSYFMLEDGTVITVPPSLPCIEETPLLSA